MEIPEKHGGKVDCVHLRLVLELAIDADRVDLTAKGQRLQRDRVEHTIHRDGRRCVREPARLHGAHKQHKKDVAHAANDDRVGVAQRVERLGETERNRDERKDSANHIPTHIRSDERMQEVHGDDHEDGHDAKEQHKRKKTHKPLASAAEEHATHALERVLARRVCSHNARVARHERKAGHDNEEERAPKDAGHRHRARKRERAGAHHGAHERKGRRPEGSLRQRAMLVPGLDQQRALLVTCHWKMMTNVLPFCIHRGTVLERPVAPGHNGGPIWEKPEID